MTIRLAVCGDYAEEQWPSMDRVAAMLVEHVRAATRGRVQPVQVCPPFARRATALPLVGRLRVAFSADRFLNRFREYPRSLRRIAADYDLFHIVDHSYARLARGLPARRTIVTCHDLDAFRSILAPGDEPRSALFRRMTREILSGLRRAASVVCDTAAVRDDLVRRGLVDPVRLEVVPLGVDDVFFERTDRRADEEAARLVGSPDGAVDVLHVGSTVPRKRLDVLLRACGRLRSRVPGLRLVRVGDPLTAEQQRIAREAGLADRLVTVESVDEPALAAIYRRVALVLQPSEREGFGLPVLEALASGTPVVASDLPVLCEVGGDAAEYCPVGDVEAWHAAAARLLDERRQAPERWAARRARGEQRARSFTWPRFGAEMGRVYEQVLERDRWSGR